MQFTSASYLVGPLLAFGVVGVLVLLLRWTYQRGDSVVARPARRGDADSYGLLVPVASPSTYAEGEVLRRTLEASGVRDNLAHTLDGPRVMVFPDDEARARELLAR
ncbi:MAG TPA: hypothetical protein VFL59_16270 [Candidatus Nanopelagicales bacterium]|nr:hypothetical protein [Candidatus Nanopelagicales bacterium]